MHGDRRVPAGFNSNSNPNLNLNQIIDDIIATHFRPGFELALARRKGNKSKLERVRYIIMANFRLGEEVTTADIVALDPYKNKPLSRFEAATFLRRLECMGLLELVKHVNDRHVWRVKSYG